MRKTLPAILLLLVTVISSTANAHFLWLVTQEASKQPAQVQLYFSELAMPDNPELLKRVQDVKVITLSQAGKATTQPLTKGKESLFVKITDAQPNQAFLLNHTYGVMTRGKNTFALQYYAKTYSAGTTKYADIPTGKQIALDIVPQKAKDGFLFKVLWKGKPLANTEINIYGDELDDIIKAKTNDKGEYHCKMPAKGLYSIRVKHVDQTKGKLKGEEYGSVRHYSTLALNLSTTKKATLPEAKTGLTQSLKYPPLKEAITSFGAAVSGDYLYVYSGHTGGTHQHSVENLSKGFRRLNLNERKKWEELTMQTPLQGLAVVAHKGKVYRIGGLSARNKKDDEEDLLSLDEVSCFDTKTKKWSAMPALPTGLSSHDAVVLGDKIYIAGGWQMLGGDKDSLWKDHGLVIDLAAKKPTWKKFDQPFKRRALTLAAHNGKIYAMGGIESEGGISHAVNIYDPQTSKWSTGPKLLGNTMNGFGTSAWDLNGTLCISGMNGIVYKLDDKSNSWKKLATLTHPRFFHRLLPHGKSRLIAVGGAGMGGHVKSIESVDLKPTHTPKVSSWNIKFPGKAKHQSQGMFLHRNSLYLFGGSSSPSNRDFSDKNLVKQAYKINLGRRTIDSFETVPAGRQSPKTAVIGGWQDAAAYSVGGFGTADGKSGSCADVMKYDFSDEEWSQCKKLPEPRTMFGLAKHDKKLWVFGGSKVDSQSKKKGFIYTKTVYCLDTEKTDAQFEKTDIEIPQHRHAFGGAVLDEKYYMVGGMAEKFERVRDCDVFDFKTKKWSTIPSPSRVRFFPQLVSLNGKLYLGGGFMGGQPEKSIEVFDPKTNKWSFVAKTLPIKAKNYRMFASKYRLVLTSLDPELSTIKITTISP